LDEFASTKVGGKQVRIVLIYKYERVEEAYLPRWDQFLKKFHPDTMLEGDWPLEVG